MEWCESCWESCHWLPTSSGTILDCIKFGGKSGFFVFRFRFNIYSRLENIACFQCWWGVYFKVNQSFIHDDRTLAFKSQHSYIKYLEYSRLSFRYNEMFMRFDFVIVLYALAWTCTCLQYVHKYAQIFVYFALF